MANIIEITDFEAPELDVFTRLTENQLLNRHEPEKGIFIAESPKVIERALAQAAVRQPFGGKRKSPGRNLGDRGAVPGASGFHSEFEVLSK